MAVAVAAADAEQPRPQWRLEPERRRRRHPGEFKMAAGGGGGGGSAGRAAVRTVVREAGTGPHHRTACEAHRDGDPRARDLQSHKVRPGG